MKTPIIILVALLAVSSHAQFVSTESSATVNNAPPNHAPNVEQLVMEAVDKLQPHVSTNDTSAQDARLHELERMVLAVNARLVASTNGITAQSVKEAVIAAAPEKYKDILATVCEAITSLFVLCRYLYAWKNGVGHGAALKAVFCGTNAPTAPRTPVNAP